MKKLVLIGVVGLLYGCNKQETIMPKSMSVNKDEVQDTLKRGTFVTKDAGHPTQGTVYLIKKRDSTLVLQFDQFSTGDGPDVDILISKDEVYNTASVMKLDDLKHSGSFVVSLPKGLDPMAYHTVMIWCEKFDVLFGSSKLQ
jgi:hypothetical protein